MTGILRINKLWSVRRRVSVDVLPVNALEERVGLWYVSQYILLKKPCILITP